MSAYIFYIKQNDRRPNLRVQLKNSDDTPLDLTNNAGVTFTMTKQGRLTPVINNVAAVVENAATGEIYYEWQENDTDTVGTYNAEFTITWTTGITQTMPEDDYIQIVIKNDLA